MTIETKEKEGILKIQGVPYKYDYWDKGERRHFKNVQLFKGYVKKNAKNIWRLDTFGLVLKIKF